MKPARGFHPIQVEAIERQTDDAVAVRFRVDPSLRPKFLYRPGQFLTLRAEIDGEEVRRTYSLCSTPGEETLRVGIKQIPGGRFSTFANQELQPGDRLEALAPDGRFGVEPGGEHHYLGVAAGSGITPILSILKTVLQEEPASQFTLIYGNRTTQSTMFREELEGLKNRYPGRLQLFYIMSRERQDIELLSGRIDDAKCQQLFNRVIPVTGIDRAFLCGPIGMVETARAALAEQGLSPDRIQTEIFTAGDQTPVSKPRNPGVRGDVRISIRLDGQTSEVFGHRDEAVLETALAAGLDLPFACRGGVCCTCKAKLIDGQVEMAVHYGLEPDEVEANYVLTCQAKPNSDRVVVDFDA